jgi:hypothetical protein
VSHFNINEKAKALASGWMVVKTNEPRLMEWMTFFYE